MEGRNESEVSRKRRSKIGASVLGRLLRRVEASAGTNTGATETTS